LAHSSHCSAPKRRPGAYSFYDRGQAATKPPVLRHEDGGVVLAGHFGVQFGRVVVSGGQNYYFMCLKAKKEGRGDTQRSRFGLSWARIIKISKTISREAVLWSSGLVLVSRAAVRKLPFLCGRYTFLNVSLLKRPRNGRSLQEQPCSGYSRTGMIPLLGSRRSPTARWAIDRIFFDCTPA
jgi:hypothetical protein